MSFLTSHGHHNASRYPIGTLLIETRLVEDQINQHMVTEALLTQAAIASVVSKEGGKAFQKLIKRLTDGK